MAKKAQKKAKQFPAQAILAENMHYPSVAKEGVVAYLENISGALSAMQNMWDAFADMRRELNKNCVHMLGSEAKIAQKASACHSFGELSAVQSKAVQECLNNYLSETQKLYMLFCKNCIKPASKPDLVKSQLIVE